MVIRVFTVLLRPGHNQRTLRVRSPKSRHHKTNGSNCNLLRVVKFLRDHVFSEVIALKYSRPNVITLL